MRIEAFQLSQFAIEDFAYLFVPLLIGSFGSKTFYFFVLSRTQLILNILNLLLQEIFLLLLVEILTSTQLNVLLDERQLSLLVQYLNQRVQTIFQCAFIKHVNLIFYREREIGADIVDHHMILRQVLQSEHHFLSTVFAYFDKLGA